MATIHKPMDAAGESAKLPSTAEPVRADFDFDINGPHAHAALQKFLWTIVVLCWPLLSKTLIADVLFQLLRAMLYWSKPDVHAGWTFIFHLGMLSGLTYFVAFGDPARVRACDNGA